MAEDLDTSQIKSWRSIITLIVFVLTNLAALFPFHIPIYVPRSVWGGLLKVLASLRIISPQRKPIPSGHGSDDVDRLKRFVRFRFPVNFVTAPLIADLFLLAILAIGRQEVHDGTIGANNIAPIDIMVFFLSLAYIAISIDASGLIRYLAFKVLQWGGKVGHRLYFYLYVFFFSLTAFIGNDPVILSGTAFLAYLTRVSSNIEHPRAWIHTQFAVANIGSAILVSSNPTNLVLAGAFNIKFINYTANMIVPTVATIIILYPFLLYIVFPSPALIPFSIEMHDLPPELRGRKAINPNIPQGRGIVEEEEEQEISSNDKSSPHLLEEVLNPFLDRSGAIFGAILMAVTLITLLALNAASQKIGEHPVFYVTLPAAFVMFCWDVGFGWFHRKGTRQIASEGRQAIARIRAERAERLQEQEMVGTGMNTPPTLAEDGSRNGSHPSNEKVSKVFAPDYELAKADTNDHEAVENPSSPSRSMPVASGMESKSMVDERRRKASSTNQFPSEEAYEEYDKPRREATLFSQAKKLYQWSQVTFPTATTVATHLPYALVPFAFCMFILVQGLVTRGWVPVFAYGWDHWVNKTGTVGAIGGMGFLSVILCNFAGTNIGTTILLSRVIQAWQQIHENNGIPITNRTFWATVYSMALGVNYGAFSLAFSASLAGLLWRDILRRKHIRVRSLEFARVNLPIIAIAMTVGCVVLVAQVYIVRDKSPYNA